MSKEKVIYKKRFEDNLMGRISSWAYCFLYSHLKWNGLSISPKYSLTRNVGIEEDCTHTVENEVDKANYMTKVKSVNFPLRHPSMISLSKGLRRRYIYKEIKRILLKSLSWK